MTSEDVAAFERCMAAGGVALFPADTVYGLATAADSDAGFERLCRLKGRSPSQPSAVMFFALERLFDELSELGERSRAACERLLPGGVTLILPNPAHRFPLACGTTPDVLGVRVPALVGALAPLTAVRTPVIQSSANRHGEPDARRIGDVDASVRAGVDFALDGGELPGAPSTVVDLSGYEHEGRLRVLREGALAAAAVERALSG